MYPTVGLCSGSEADNSDNTSYRLPGDKFVCMADTQPYLGRRCLITSYYKSVEEVELYGRPDHTLHAFWQTARPPLLPYLCLCRTSPPSLNHCFAACKAWG